MLEIETSFDQYNYIIQSRQNDDRLVTLKLDFDDYISIFRKCLKLFSVNVSI